MRRLSFIDYLALFLFSFVVTVTVMTFIYPPASRMDFSIYLLVTRVAELHQPLYPLFIESVPFPYTHPTSLIPFFVPFLFIPVNIAASLWNGLSLVSLLIGVYLLLRKIVTKIKFSIFLLILSSVLLLEPVRESLLFGQNNLVVLLLLMLAFLFSQKDKKKDQFWSGICLGLASALKLFPIFLIIYFLLKKQWISALTSIIVLGGFFLLGTFGHVTYIWQYIHYGMSVVNATRPLPNDQSVSAMMLMFLPSSSFLRQMIVVLIYSVFLLISYLTWKRRQESLLSDFLFFSALIAATILIITPLAWVHHLVFVIPFCIGLLLQALQTKKMKYILLFCLTFLSVFVSWEDTVIFLQTNGFGYFPLLSFHAFFGIGVALIGNFYLRFSDLLRKRSAVIGGTARRIHAKLT